MSRSGSMSTATLANSEYILQLTYMNIKSLSSEKLLENLSFIQYFVFNCLRASLMTGLLLYCYTKLQVLFVVVSCVMSWCSCTYIQSLQLVSTLLAASQSCVLASQLTEQEVEIVLDKCMVLFRFLQEKVSRLLLRQNLGNISSISKTTFIEREGQRYEQILYLSSVNKHVNKHMIKQLPVCPFLACSWQ